MRLTWVGIVVLISIVNLGWFWQGSVVKKNREAKKLYEDRKFDEALSKWQDAQVDNPDKKELHYNIGGALHEKRDYGKALSQYEQVLDAKDDEVKAKAYYNMGNTHYRMGKLLEAIQDYEHSLQINPDDEDAKYNIEFIKKKLEEQKREAQGEQKEQREEQREEEKEVASEKKETQEKDKAEEERKSGGEEKGEKEGEMSKEDAFRILDAFKDDERDIQKQLRIQPMEGGYKVDKDW